MLDILGASLLLVILAPVLLASVFAVVIGSGRPAFFAHRRLGRGGRPFRCWKLRTMHVDAERSLEREPALRRRYVENGYKLPAAQDPRVTWVGRWLRRTYLDEVPQLINVLAGQMSLVGPRPIVRDELEQYGRHGEDLLRVKPGLFGEWTSRGRSRPAYPERALLELEYVRTRTFTRDLRILLRSIPVVLRGQSDRA